MAAGHNVDVERWQAMFEGLMARGPGQFARVEPRHRARSLVLGLLSDLPATVGVQRQYTGTAGRV